MEAIAALAEAAERGDPQARIRLFEALYTELHRLARRQLWQHGAALTLSATTLLHEAYLDLTKGGAAVFPDKARFMAYAARAMRGLIIDHARRGQAQKRGGLFEFTQINTQVSEQLADPSSNPWAASGVDADKLQAISDALEQLAGLDPKLAELVDLKFFAGLSFGDIAAQRGVSERTVQRDWAKARALLHQHLSDDNMAPESLQGPA